MYLSKKRNGKNKHDNLLPSSGVYAKNYKILRNRLKFETFFFFQKMQKSDFLRKKLGPT